MLLTLLLSIPVSDEIFFVLAGNMQIQLLSISFLKLQLLQYGALITFGMNMHSFSSRTPISTSHYQMKYYLHIKVVCFTKY